MRTPYVDMGATGCRASAQIDSEEANTMDPDDPRYSVLLLSAIAWESQAEFFDLLDHMRAYHGMPGCFDPIDGCESGVTDVHAKYHETDPPGANFGNVAPLHPVDDLSAVVMIPESSD